MNPALPGGVTGEPALPDAMELASDPELEARFAGSAHRILSDLVSGGAALGWIGPPSRDEVADLLGRVGERRYDKVFQMLDFRREG
ncbi:hypothetical protein [Streptomyces sp. NPDC060031]|uniref:hypothetical protein n=1 Tax=Streptomyces sp. NPDC060031 TaxID=3347043 RepID=UPI003681EF9F